MAVGEFFMVIAVISAIILIFLGFKYPRGGWDWPHDRAKTFRMIISGILFFIIMGLIYWITRYWDYPVSGKGVVYLSLIVFLILFVLGIVFPRGRRA